MTFKAETEKNGNGQNKKNRAQEPGFQKGQ